eukprot:5727711-Pleurochrysis_carterae.AAC.2
MEGIGRRGHDCCKERQRSKERQRLDGTSRRANVELHRARAFLKRCVAQRSRRFFGLGPIELLALSDVWSTGYCTTWSGNSHSMRPSCILLLRFAIPNDLLTSRFLAISEEILERQQFVEEMLALGRKEQAETVRGQITERLVELRRLEQLMKE